MKLAVVGSGSTALLAAHHFYQLGAHVVLFATPSLEEKCKGHQALEEIFQFLSTQMVIRAGLVLRIHKRFLGKSEEVKNRSRFHDLFRVVYSKDPKDSILKQVAQNPEIFKQLGDEVLNSLKHPIESYEDFDLVIEATGGKSVPDFMGPGGVPAINELNLMKEGKIHYGLSEISQLDQYKKITAVGSGVGFDSFLEKLKFKLSTEEESKAILVTDENLYQSKYQTLVMEIEKIIEEDFSNKMVEHQKKVFEWRELDDFVKNKIPQPKEPEKRLEIYCGYDVSNVDQLLDQSEVYLTIESPDFRDFCQEANHLKTIATGGVFVFKAKEHNSSLAHALQAGERGYFNIKPSDFKNIQIEINRCEKEVMNLFSREVQ